MTSEAQPRMPDGHILGIMTPAGKILGQIPARLANLLVEVAFVDDADIVIACTTPSGTPMTIHIEGAADIMAARILKAGRS